MKSFPFFISFVVVCCIWFHCFYSLSSLWLYTLIGNLFFPLTHCLRQWNRRMDNGRFGFPVASRRSCASHQESSTAAFRTGEIQNGLVQQQDQYRLDIDRYTTFAMVLTVVDDIKRKGGRWWIQSSHPPSPWSEMTSMFNHPSSIAPLTVPVSKRDDGKYWYWSSSPSLSLPGLIRGRDIAHLASFCVVCMLGGCIFEGKKDTDLPRPIFPRHLDSSP